MANLKSLAIDTKICTFIPHRRGIKETQIRHETKRQAWEAPLWRREPLVAAVPLPTLVLSAGTSSGVSPPMSKLSNTSAEPSVNGRPLERAHAHNDYNHDRPLLDALSFGFTSVEADIHLRDGQLYVAHDAQDLCSDRTLSSLYLDPLNARVTQTGGSVFPYGTPFTLWIDVKTEAEETYRVLRSVLERYQNILTVYSEDGVRPGAMTVIISGNRSRAIMEPESIRYASYDGRLDDLGSTAPPSLIPFISDKWTRHFGWTGRGTMPKVEREKLRTIVEAAHSEGRRVRFWATPDRPNARREAIWQALVDADVDLISSDDLEGLRLFLSERDPVSLPPRSR